MTRSAKRWLVGAGVGVYLYALLPATAVLFYELYHLTGVEPLYWGYGAFKAAGYYFGVWPYRLAVCVGVAAAIALAPSIPGWVRARATA